ncbi:hypothetical protein QE152_g18143 [Popillia japonica]|uniref:Uncharacterized protein n=1 Tax=Popillia japonica TaxID=7064 RepID=A0AAW1L488_POPJA
MYGKPHLAIGILDPLFTSDLLTDQWTYGPKRTWCEVKEASRVFRIPFRTLSRRIRKPPKDGKSWVSSQSNSTNPYIFAEFAEKLGLEEYVLGTKGKEKICAGYDRLRSFLERNLYLVVRKSEGLSLATVREMSREENSFTVIFYKS